MKEYMKSISTFQNYMLNCDEFNYIGRYCRSLSCFGWKQFYYQMKEPLEFIGDEKYLFYILKWILKEPFDDLSFEVYIQVVQNPEQLSDILIKDDWWEILNQRYAIKFYDLISGELECSSKNSEHYQSKLSVQTSNEFIF